MSQTPYKTLLICYHFGARGDFLASILAGDKLKECYKDPWISNPNADCIKIHNPNPSHTYFAVGNVSLDGFVFDTTARLKFNTVKISINNYSDKLECALLKLSKTQQLTSKNILQHIHMGDQHNNDIKLYDHLFDYNVPYELLWSIDYITDLYYQYTNKCLTLDEINRIEHNMLINRLLINSAKEHIGSVELEKIYNHLFNGVMYS